jgi:hypothetical protein
VCHPAIVPQAVSVTPDDQRPEQRPTRDPHETRKMQARLFLGVAALILFSAITQWSNAEDTSDRVWTGVLAVIAIGVGVYFWRVLREERPPDDES